MAVDLQLKAMLPAGGSISELLREAMQPPDEAPLPPPPSEMEDSVSTEWTFRGAADNGVGSMMCSYKTGYISAHSERFNPR